MLKKRTNATAKRNRTIRANTKVKGNALPFAGLGAAELSDGPADRDDTLGLYSLGLFPATRWIRGGFL